MLELFESMWYSQAGWIDSLHYRFKIKKLENGKWTQPHIQRRLRGRLKTRKLRECFQLTWLTCPHQLEITDKTRPPKWWNYPFSCQLLKVERIDDMGSITSVTNRQILRFGWSCYNIFSNSGQSRILESWNPQDVCSETAFPFHEVLYLSTNIPFEFKKVLETFN